MASEGTSTVLSWIARNIGFVADLVTGQMMDLFNAFDTATLQPTSPAINLDGDWVTTGSEGSGLHGPEPRQLPEQRLGHRQRIHLPGFELVDPTPTDPSDLGPFAYRRNLPQPNGVTGGRSS